MGAGVFAQGGLRWTSHSLYEDIFTPSVGINWHINSYASLKSSYSRGYRNPAIVDLFLFPTSNPDLQPEKAWNVDLSFKHIFKDTKAFVEATVFYLEGENFIEEVLIGGPPPQKRNTGASIHQGFSLQATAFPEKSWRLRASYEYLDVSQTRLFAPRHTLRLSSQYRAGSWRIQGSVGYIHGLVTRLNPRKLKDNVPQGRARVSYAILPWMESFCSRG